MPKGIKHKDVGTTLTYDEFHADDAHIVAEGTSFPASPTTGDLFTRTDLAILFRYNGTAWIPLGLRDLFTHRRTGTAAPECWYTHAITAVAAAAFTTVDNTLYAIPFIVPKTITLDRIAINITTAATNSTLKARLGIYRDNGNLYPGALLLDAGETADLALDIKALTISQVALPGLYWLVAAFPAMGTTKAAIRSMALGSFFPILGISSGLGTAWNTHYSVAFTYAALPSTFPTGATVATVASPGIFVRLSG